MITVVNAKKIEHVSMFFEITLKTNSFRIFLSFTFEYKIIKKIKTTAKFQKVN